MLIAFEGIDGSGKATQSRMFAEKLHEETSLPVRQLSFPAYDETYCGPLIRAYLDGELGGLNDNHPLLVSLLYALDRYEVWEAIATSGVIVADRYTPSNVAHQCGKLAAKGRRWDELAQQILEIEHDLLSLPMPDFVFYLDIAPEQSAERTGKFGGKDIHEEARDYQAGVREVYLASGNSTACWYCVDNFDEGTPRSPLAIAAEIWTIFTDSALGKELLSCQTIKPSAG